MQHQHGAQLRDGGQELAGAPAGRLLPQRVPRHRRRGRRHHDRRRDDRRRAVPALVHALGAGVYTVGFLFAYWLFYEALTDIHALCPWCLLITVTTTLVWAGLTRMNVREGHVIDLPGRAGPSARRFVADGNDWFVTIAVLVVLAA